MNPTLLQRLRRIERTFRFDGTGARHPRDYYRPADLLRRVPGWTLPR